jgi:hypothetical protein
VVDDLVGDAAVSACSIIVADDDDVWLFFYLLNFIDFLIVYI